MALYCGVSGIFALTSIDQYSDPGPVLNIMVAVAFFLATAIATWIVVRLIRTRPRQRT
ncbi:MAG: hypothetical protein IPK93_10525 [Solirubrobacterales bacterium]|nr:hypothetical protein [Solirubrobacterales bacterium]